MKVKVRLNGIMSSLCNWREREFLLEAGTTIAMLKKIVENEQKEIEFNSLCVSTAVNHKIETADKQLNDGDEVSFLPPIAGG